MNRSTYSSNSFRLTAQSGLTLVEIMIVLVILSVVMSVIIGKVVSGGDKAKRQITELQMEQLKADIEQFRLRYNTLPRSIEDLSNCTETTGQGCLPITDADSINDAWGNKFTYSASGRTYQLQTLGADGVGGGEGVDYDFTVKGP